MFRLIKKFIHLKEHKIYNLMQFVVKLNNVFAIIILILDVHRFILDNV